MSVRMASPELALSALRGIVAWPVHLSGGSGEGWAPLGALHDEAVLGPVIEQVAQRLGDCEARVAASTLQLGLAARLWSVTLGCIALEEVLPDLDDFLWREDRGALVLRVDRPRATAADTVEELLAPARDAVVQWAGLPAGLPEGLVLGNIASALAALPKVLGITGLAVMVAPLLEQPPLAGHMAGGRRKQTCCLFYRVPGGGLCSDCVFDVAPA